MKYFTDDELDEVFHKVLTNDHFGLRELDQNDLPYTLMPVDSEWKSDIVDSYEQSFGRFTATWVGNGPGLLLKVYGDEYLIMKRNGRWQALMQEENADDSEAHWFDL